MSWAMADQESPKSDMMIVMYFMRKLLFATKIGLFFKLGLRRLAYWSMVMPLNVIFYEEILCESYNIPDYFPYICVHTA